VHHGPNKHDAADAEACCEAVRRPGMRFVPAKSEGQQSLLMLHRLREQLLKQRTATTNALRAHLAEFGIVAAQRRAGLRELLAVIGDPEDRRLPPLARELLQGLVEHLRGFCQLSRPNGPAVRDVVALSVDELNIWLHRVKVARDLTDPVQRLLDGSAR
jgi:transposase